MRGRRELVVAVLVCAAGAVLVLVAARATWVVEVTPRPAPLPDERTGRTGGDLRPWLPALGWAALAGAGALVAARGLLRRVVGALLVLAGGGIAATAGTSDVSSGWWQVLAAVGGAAVATVGVLAVVRGSQWPALGARYERNAAAGASSAPASTPSAESSPAALWEALDRGEDPTVAPASDQLADPAGEPRGPNQILPESTNVGHEGEVF